MSDREAFHTMSYWQLAFVLAGLFVLTGVTIGVSYLDLGVFNVWIALTVASCKSSLVLLFFMHMKGESPVIRVSFISTIVFLAIMIGFTFWDTAFR